MKILRARRPTGGTFKGKGFTLIEVLVSVAIFVIVTSLVLLGQRSFGGSVLLSNLAYDVALSVRQAQVYGVSVKQARGVSSGLAFNRSYGIHFHSTGHYTLFTDLDGDGKYDTAAEQDSGCLASPPEGHLPECISLFRLEQGNSITKLCADNDCAGANNIDTLDILFHRPDPEPIIHGLNSLVNKPYTPYTNASVTVSSPQGTSRSVCISASGQISVKATCP